MPGPPRRPSEPSRRFPLRRAGDLSRHSAEPPHCGRPPRGGESGRCAASAGARGLGDEPAGPSAAGRGRAFPGAGGDLQGGPPDARRRTAAGGEPTAASARRHALPYGRRVGARSRTAGGRHGAARYRTDPSRRTRAPGRRRAVVEGPAREGAGARGRIRRSPLDAAPTGPAQTRRPARKKPKAPKQRPGREAARRRDLEHARTAAGEADAEVVRCERALAAAQSAQRTATEEDEEAAEHVRRLEHDLQAARQPQRETGEARRRHRKPVRRSRPQSAPCARRAGRRSGPAVSSGVWRRAASRSAVRRRQGPAPGA